MGNCSSCACIKLASASGHGGDTDEGKTTKLVLKAIVVVHSVEQRVLEMGGGAPLEVAEIMLEFPGHFVSEYETDIATQIINNTANAHEEAALSTTMIMKRATPLPADHEASPGRVYILFPMHKLHTRLAPHEYASYMRLLTSYLHAQFRPPATSCSRKKTLHSLMQTTSAKVTPLSSHELEEIPPHLTASHQPAQCGGEGAEIDDEIIDSLLQQFCSSQSTAASASAGNAFSKSGSLVRSKSWIPKLETISESSVLVV